MVYDKYVILLNVKLLMYLADPGKTRDWYTNILFN